MRYLKVTLVCILALLVGFMLSYAVMMFLIN